MKNKKRLAVLAMSAVMAMTSMPFSAFAADFSAGEGVTNAVVADAGEAVDAEEDAADEAGTTVDINEISWDDLESTVASYTTVAALESAINAGILKVDGYTVTGWATAPNTSSDCQTGKKIILKITVDGNDYWSNGGTTTKTVYQTRIMGSHSYVSGSIYYVNDEKISGIPDCKTYAGKEDITRKTGEYCSVCGEWKGTEPAAEKVTVSHTRPADVKDKYAAGTNTAVNADGTTISLVDPTKDGTYSVTTPEYKCSVCGETIPETTVSGLTLKATATTGETVLLTDAGSNIKTDLSGMTPEAAKKMADAGTIQLKDCSQAGYYYVATFKTGTTDKSLTNTEAMTAPLQKVEVKAHHVYNDAVLVYADKADEGKLVLSADKKTVTNLSCTKDIEYYLQKTCAVCGYVDKGSKLTAARSTTNHSGVPAAMSAIEAAKKAGTTVSKDWVNANVDGVYVKLTPETAICETSGTATFEFFCKDCKASLGTITGVKVAALGHKVTVKKENEVEATCTKAGSYESVKTCERCGKETSRETVSVAKLRHTNANAAGYTVKDSDISSVELVGNVVYGADYTTGQVIKNSYTLGSDKTDAAAVGTLEAYVFTNCTRCKDNETRLMTSVGGKTPVNVTFEVESVTKPTVDKYGKITAAGSITVKTIYTAISATDTTKTVNISAEKTVPYYGSAITKKADLPAEFKDGLTQDSDGVFRYYVNGKVASDYTGLVDYNLNKYYVINGVLASGANGLTQVGDNWYYLALGRVVSEYTGAVPYNGAWFYVKNGVLDTTMTGLLPYDGGTFLFIGGRIATEVKGLWQNIDGSGDWFYLADGQVLTAYTGVVFYDGAAFYVQNGKLAKSYNGTVEYEGLKFKVIGGQLYGQVK